MYPVSDAFLDAITGTHRAVSKARLLTTTQFGPSPTGTELPILSGDVKLSATADVKSTLELTVPGDYWAAVQPYGREVWVARGVAFGDGTEELVPLGYFRIDDVEQEEAPYGPVRLSCSDRTSQLKQNRVLYPFQVPVGYTHRELFERLVNGRTSSTGVPPEQTQAAQLIYDRMLLGQPIFEDWTWAGAPTIVGTYNDALQALWAATDGSIPAQTRAAILIDYRILCHAPIFEDWTWSGCPQVVADYNDPLLALWQADGRPEATTWLQTYVTAHGGTMPTQTQAAGIIRARIDSGLTYYEDWTWPDPPQIVGQYNDQLLGLYPGKWNDRPAAIAWLDSYTSSHGGGGVTVPALTFLSAYIAANGGTNVINSLGYAALIQGPAIPIVWNGYDPDRYTITGGPVVENSTYEFMAKLADDRGCVLRFDEFGQLNIDIREPDPDSAAVYAITPGQTGNLIKASRKTTRDGVYNIVVAYGSDVAAPTGYQLAYLNTPGSPLRWDSQFGAAPRYFASPLLRTPGAAADAAATILSRYTGLPYTVGLWTVPNPAIRPQDAISAKVQGLAETHIIDTVTIPLSISGAGPVEIATKTLNEVIIPEEPTDDGTGGTGGSTQPTAAQIMQEKAFELTSTAENSTVQWWTQFGYLQDIGDGRGYTTGIAGFTSATGDLLGVVQQYVSTKPGNVLASFVPGLQTCANTGMGGSASTAANTNLGTPFKTAWAAAAQDPVFQQVQIAYRNRVYWTPAYNAAVADGLGALGLALYYDTSINHGPGVAGSGDGSFDDIRSGTTSSGGGSVSTVGQTANSGSSSSSSSDKTVLSKFTAGVTGTLTGGHARLSLSASGSASTSLVVYADSAGAPGARLAQSALVSVTGTTEAVVNYVFTGTNQVAITNGTPYWIGPAWTDPGTISVAYSRDATATQVLSVNSFAPTTFGTGVASSGPVDAYLDVNTGGGGSGPPSQGGSETAWLTAFLAKRSTVLTAWGDNPVDGRISMFTALLGTGNLTLTTPFAWSVYGDSYTMATDPYPYGWTAPPTTGGGSTAFANPGAAHNIGSAPGQNSFNLGVGFESDPKYGTAHHDFGRGEIEAGLVIPGYYELNAAGEVLMSSHPGGGKTSDKTKYARVEYRELDRNGTTKAAWNASSGRHYMRGRSAVDSLSGPKPEMVIAQVHDAADDRAMIYRRNSGTVQAKIGDAIVATLDTGAVLTEFDDWMIEVVDGQIKFYWHDMTTPAHTGTLTGSGMYFKAGAYMQWNLSNGDSTIGKVRLTDLEHWHTGWPAPARPAGQGGGTTGSGGGTGTGSTGGTGTADDGVEAAKLLGWGAVIDGDEFAYTGAPNSSKWGLYDGPGHDGNGTRDPEAFNVAGGILTCTGTAGGSTGGMAFKRDEKYCRVEWRIRAYSINPSGGGHRYHPVLIQWPTSDLWPQGGEFDFAEYDCDSGLYEAFLHIPGNDGSAQEYVKKTFDISQWHNVAFEWSASGIKGWVNGQQVFNFPGFKQPPGPMHPTFQLDNFYGAGMEPAKFEAQWFRVYALPSSTSSGGTTTTLARARSIRVAPSGGLGQFNMSSNAYIAGFRFEPDTQISIDRFYFQINGEGASCDVDRTGYGNGNGGTWYGRIVDCDQNTGLPITSSILCSESINACTRHNSMISEFGLGGTHQLHYVQWPSTTLQPGRMYAFLLSNTHASPGTGGSASSGNHMSVNMNFGPLAQAGPNGANTLNPSAPGAMYGLGPRETVLWSANSGSTWKFGDQIGWYGNGDGDFKHWPVGYRITGGANTPIGWPLRQWASDATGGAITYNNIPKAVTITGAGGTNDGSGSVGVITVTNVTTGASSTTASLGSGKVSGNLNTPITASAGDNIRIATSGRIGNGATDAGPLQVYSLGSQRPWTYTVNVGTYPPTLYLVPDPFF